MAYDIVLVVFLHLCDIGVDKRLTLSPLDNEFGRSVAQLASGQQHVLDEAEYTVLFDLLRWRESFLELLAHCIGRI
jgi:hypothetical protein